MSGDQLDRWRAAVQRNDKIQEETMPTTGTDHPTRQAIEVAHPHVLLVVIVKTPSGQMDGPTELAVREIAEEAAVAIEVAVLVQAGRDAAE